MLTDWLPIDSAPDKDYVLLIDARRPHYQGLFLGQVLNGNVWNPDGHFDSATHWMPLPEPPKEAH